MDLKNNIMHEIDWRVAELALIKTNHLSSNLSTLRCNVIKKYSIVAIYALFEGFIVQSMQLYINEINKMKISRNSLNIKIINNYLENTYNIHAQRVNEDKKMILIDELEFFFASKEIELSKKIETESNVNFKVLNKILNTYNLQPIDDKKINDGLNKLLKYRNSIAHGEVSVKVENTTICELTEVVVKTMDLVMDSIMLGFENKVFLK